MSDESTDVTTRSQPEPADQPAARSGSPGKAEVGGVPIVLEHVTKRYPGQAEPAVEDVSMEIPAGHTVVFVGPSGCGKTTTMKMINRLIEPSEGRILIGDQDILTLNPDELRRGIGYVIQQIGLFPHMTIAQNIGTVPKMLGWNAKRIADRVDEMLNLVGLEPGDFRSRYPRQLSGGQQQRIGVARALAADPPVLLMDEPFGAIDPITRGRLQDELVALQQQIRKTIVFVTHDFDEAVKLGDRIAILRQRSEIAQYDTPDAILAEPADDFVASFVGRTGTLKRLALVNIDDVNLAPAQHGTSLPEVSASSTLAEVLDVMLANGSDACVVVDERKGIQGLISLQTVLELLSEVRHDSAADAADANGTHAARHAHQDTGKHASRDTTGGTDSTVAGRR